MSKFGKYRGGDPLKSSAAPGSLQTISKEDRLARYAAKAKAAEARPAGKLDDPVFAILLDATASMTTLIEDAKRNIATILDRLYAEANARVRIRLFVYRDYDVDPQWVCESSALTGDAQELARWLGGVQVFGGGANAGEAIEAVLAAVDRAGEVDAVLLAGDEPSNPRSELDARGRRQTQSAHDWARQFAGRGTPIHTFAVGDDDRTIRDFETIAQFSGGKAGRLDGSEAMIDMAVMAMLASVTGAGSVRRYMQRYALSHQAREFGTRLLTGPTANKT